MPEVKPKGRFDEIREMRKKVKFMTILCPYCGHEVIVPKIGIIQCDRCKAVID